MTICLGEADYVLVILLLFSPFCWGGAKLAEIVLGVPEAGCLNL